MTVSKIELESIIWGVTVSDKVTAAFASICISLKPFKKICPAKTGSCTVMLSNLSSAINGM